MARQHPWSIVLLPGGILPAQAAYQGLLAELRDLPDAGSERIHLVLRGARLRRLARLASHATAGFPRAFVDRSRGPDLALLARPDGRLGRECRPGEPEVVTVDERLEL